MSLFLRNLIFTFLQPGIVAGIIPYLILQAGHSPEVLQPLINPGVHSIGVVLFLSGLCIMITCIVSFAVHGRGTLSPIDRTKKLVVSGLYQYSRNPMYVGVMLILIGETVYFQSLHLLIYSACVFIMFHLFILLIEEPRLRRDFGEAYKSYWEQVRRWL